MGQIAHQPRPRNGTTINISSAHHTIHTKTMLKLWLPTGVPIKPGEDGEEEARQRNDADDELRPAIAQRRFHDRVAGEFDRRHLRIDPNTCDYGQRAQTNRAPQQIVRADVEFADHEGMQRAARHRTAEAKRS